ncbi:YheC/YheD family protein [Paenibacillus pasadenensis]|uniref:YheC/YheD family endospore coat-associated protein n=1 Tax=Paenibacillus pasadenensis TaxID=217090 RepID=UPI00203BD3AB|nr:YheC/YheD family protein [Paenibacillus pasadenensis]MCM3747991.1 YheC/YheD family protein [Paenibacillus pasadenensis]
MEFEHEHNISATAELAAKRPVLAILTVTGTNKFGFRGNRANFADLIRTGRGMGFTVYVLTIRSLKFTKPLLSGFSLNETSGEWERGFFPFPDLVYNRIPRREDELRPRVQRKLRLLLATPTIKGIFNPAFFDKWELFEWLNNSESTKKYIPATRKMASAASLNRMMTKHPYLYLKPVSGKAGKGIMTIRVMEGKPLPYRLRIQEKKKSSTYNCSTVSKLWARILKESGGEMYIAQQGIQLASYEDRQFDLRALVQKNTIGKWSVTGIGARVAGSRSITTHVPRGGSIEDPEKLLVQAFGADQARLLLAKTRLACVQLAGQIETASGASYGEMSMDIGVDADGSLWFFEANAKPMKFDEPHIRKKSLERIFHYSAYLMKSGKAETAGGA